MYSFVTVASLLLAAAAAAPKASLPWTNPNYHSYRTVMVHLFEWKWKDIADECERFLGPNGFAGVQVSPIQENVILPRRPWWERYQPISYLWNTRSGNEEDFRDMVHRCNLVKVRIYVDVILNHMTGDYSRALGTGGSTANTTAREYHSVPYGPNDFNNFCSINDYENSEETRNCELLGLHDLNQARRHVREKIIGFMNETIEAGVAGFRIDAAQHMWFEDLAAIYSSLRNLNTSYFNANTRPYIYQEVNDLGDGVKSVYKFLGAVTEYQYGREVSNAMNGINPLKWFSNFGEPWGMLPSQDALVFIDNHNNQRGHRSSGLLTHKQAKLYKMAVAFMLAYPYGNPRLMSSFAFDDVDQGPPANEHEEIISPVITKNLTCEAGWICEHRWRQIVNMVLFKNSVVGYGISHWWDNGSNQIAFSLGDHGFIAINADKSDLKANLQTKLVAGRYCDVISGAKNGNSCTGKMVVVDRNGNAQVEILQSDEDGVLAIPHNSRVY